MKRKLKIEKIILESLDPYFYSVLDVSEQHRGHQNFKENVESHFEIIIVCGPSIDNTYEIALEIKKEKKNLKLWSLNNQKTVKQMLFGKQLSKQSMMQ